MNQKLDEYFLNPGELIFSKGPILIKTVLGSCVSVCLYDKINGYGGMCHYLLPDSVEKSQSTKYGNIAVKLLVHKFFKAGSKKEFLEASVIGGALIIFDEREIFFIGDRNADMAIQVLKENGIRIKSVNTGGEKGKKVFFNTSTNQILVQTLEHIEIDDLYNAKQTKE